MTPLRTNPTADLQGAPAAPFSFARLPAAIHVTDARQVAIVFEALEQYRLLRLHGLWIGEGQAVEVSRQGERTGRIAWDRDALTRAASARDVQRLIHGLLEPPQET